MTRRRDAFDFSPSPSDRRRQARAQIARSREERRRRAANLKRSKKDALRRKRELRRIESQRKRLEHRQHREDERRLRAERKRWKKTARPGRVGRGDRNMRTAVRLVDWFGTLLGRVGEKERAELIAYADEHIAEVYERTDTSEVDEAMRANAAASVSNDSFISRLASRLRTALGF